MGIATFSGQSGGNRKIDSLKNIVLIPLSYMRLSKQVSVEV
jgi:hypothetical protein